MSLQTRITALVNAIGGDIKSILAAQGNLANLTTAQQSSLVGAINELQAEINAISAGGNTVINDAAGNGDTTVTWSANKIYDELEAYKASILGGAGAAYDTLLELQNELQDNDGAIANLMTAVGNRLRLDAPGGYTAAQQQRGIVPHGYYWRVGISDGSIAGSPVVQGI